MKYELLEFLGSGGMGQVYRARDTVLDRIVALKLLRGQEPKKIERLTREARAQARVRHEGVCEVYETGETPEGKTFIAMQFVDGVPLVRAAESMDLRQKVAVMRRVAEAVQAAHSEGLVHRDLKPANVLVERRGGGRDPEMDAEVDPEADAEVDAPQSWRPYVLDFGIAVVSDEPALTTEGNLLGTPAYMAPEQVTGGTIDRRTDVYALGVILFELLSGRRLVEGASNLEVLVQIAQDEAPDLAAVHPGVPRDLATIVAKCVERRPALRYASARLLAEDLDRFLAGEPVLAQAPSLVYRMGRQLRRYKLALAVAALAVVLGLVGGLKYTLDLEAERSQAVAAQARAENALAEAEQVTSYLVDLFALADPDHAQGREIRAGEILEAGKEEIERLASRPLVQARLREALGQVYSNLGLFDEGRELLAASVDARRRFLPASDPRLVETLVELGHLELRDGRADEAAAHFREALVRQGRGGGLRHPLAADALGRLGAALRRQGHLEQAEAVLEASVRIFEAVGGAEHLAFSRALNSFGILRKHQGRSEESEALYLRALAVRRAHLGDDHPQTLAIQGNLATLYHQMERLEESIALQRRTLASKERVYGDDHPSLARTLNNLAAALWAAGETDEVRRLLERCLDIQMRALGPEHPVVSVTLGNLGELHWGEGDLERAEALYRHSLELKEKAYGADHFRTAFALQGLADVLRDQGEFAQAEQLYRRTLAIRRSELAPDHPETRKTLERYAELLRRTGREAEAAALFETEGGR